MQTNVSKNYDINARILHLIKYLGVSNNKFASEIGISSSRMSNIATNRNNPDSELLMLIAKKYTDVNINWILTGVGTMFTNPVNIVEDLKADYNDDCIGCKEKQRNIDKLQDTITQLLDESRKDHELIRKLILNIDGSINKQSRSA
jgi:transcriptional regulator with XRE-family HTH domain